MVAAKQQGNAIISDTMSSPSMLDLTGQASEDERSSRSSERAQNNHDLRRHPGSSESKSRKEQNNPARANNSQDISNSRNDSSPQAILAAYLPSPIDLWKSRTATSLFLLPIVFIIYVILQLPLHYNSTTEKAEWQGRAKAVDDLTSDLNLVKKELDTVKGDQAEIKGMVSSLRRRLGKMKERRAVREEYLRNRERQRLEEEERLQREQQQGIAKDGPIASVAMAKALAVATFAGQPNAGGAGKKDN